MGESEGEKGRKESIRSPVLCRAWLWMCCCALELKELVRAAAENGST